MLDVLLRDVSFRYPKDGFALHAISAEFPRSTHTALVGPSSGGTSTLLALLAGRLRPQSGDVILGQRRVNDLKPAHRPIFSATADIDVPGRWSVQHALVAAVRTRTLDREDRHREYALAIEKWELASLLERRVSTLSNTERTRVHLARIELLRPAVMLADRIFEHAGAGERIVLADRFFRTMRVHGTTVVSVPSARDELAFSEQVVVLSGGRVVQCGTSADVFAHPADDAAAIAGGEADLIPVTIRGTLVESVIGAWNVDPPPFQGSGVAVVRPGDFRPAAAGAESDLIFGIEEAGFAAGRWLATGVLSGGTTLRVELAQDAPVHKGRLIALCYDPRRFLLLPRAAEHRATSVPTDVIPPLRDSR